MSHTGVDSKHCVFCNSTSFGTTSTAGHPNGCHKHGSNGQHCIYCGSTSQFLEKVVFKNGLPEFEGVRRLIVVNQFAYIQTNDFEGLPDQIGELNDAAITAALHESDIVVLTWGSSNRFEVRKAFVHGLLGGIKHKTLLQTKMHPSRVRYDGFIQPYVIK